MVIGIKLCSYFVVTIHDTCSVIFQAECFVLLSYYFPKYVRSAKYGSFCSSLISCFPGALLLLLKVKESLWLINHHAMNTYGVSGNVSPCILSFDTRRSRLVSLSFNPTETDWGTQWIEPGEPKAFLNTASVEVQPPS